MEMEVMFPSPAVDFNFDSSNCTSPYLTAPSSPQRLAGFFYSAPTSPGRGGAAGVPFTWEEKPGTPKSAAAAAAADDADEFQDSDDFAFDFSGQLETHSLPADQLFSGGKIRPLKPPPKFQYEQNRALDSPKSPRSPTRLFREAFSPRRKKSPDNFDPFAAALEKSRQANSIRGRDRTTRPAPPPSSSKTPPAAGRSKPSRSLSPYRVSDLLFDNHHHPPPPSNSIFSSSFWYKKWKIKDLLLFRSASESRATEKQQLLSKKRRQDDVRNSSFRSTDSAGSVSSRRGPPISAHELHYTVNRAVSEEMKKRTSLPYKQGLLGCLGFHPTGPEISRGPGPTGSMSRG
ncbi:uncharacterized protein LOC127262001 [Andrographis paniculata]|uniref:uncharacterized protein LOC127262001 n=1 Tax=Andrographis paniculata TaxID=175694 RepID=UPI0021E7D0DD|nr:uncharacterized protein LOC127262001 [Andrographis paniculata]